MIIDLTGSALLEASLTPKIGYEIDYAAKDEWYEYRNKRMKSPNSRKEAVALVETILQDPDDHMQGILARACSREIRSRVIYMIKSARWQLRMKNSEARGIVAEAIVALDCQVRKDREDREAANLAY
ncbi:hypothetical protein LCGC14_2593370 [marine sediment metagenome]|uniref:Uncharacterized protein n=1 Tax=marine sediment metagenome TaxID=412755 RepID=A0A0F9ABA4_9ZZZZ